MLDNRTIDDEFGDSATKLVSNYSLAEGWNQGPGCSICWAQPNSSGAFMGSWHDSTHYPNDSELKIASVSFNGEFRLGRIALAVD